MDPRLAPISDIRVLRGKWHGFSAGSVSGTFIRNGETEMFQASFITMPDDTGDNLVDVFALRITRLGDSIPVMMSEEEEGVFRKEIKKWANNNVLS